MKEKFIKALGAPKKHLPVRAVKYTIASSYCVDGNILIERHDIVEKNEMFNHRSLRAKSVVDLLMSIECSLKAVAISLTPDSESPSESYKSVRKHSHGIEKLLSHIKTEGENRVSIPSLDQRILDNLKALGIGVRYSYDIWVLKLTSDVIEIFFDKDLVSSTIDDFEWVKKLRNIAVIVNNFSLDVVCKYLKPHAILFSERHSKFTLELKKFKSDLGIS